MRASYVGCTKAKRNDVVKVNDKGKQPLQQARYCVSDKEKRMPVMMDLIRFFGQEHELCEWIGKAM